MHTTSFHRLSRHLGGALVLVTAFATLGSFGCMTEDGEDVATSSDELRSHAAEAGLVDFSAEGRAVIAVANDRNLDVDDYVFRAKISRKTAEAIIATRNGTNGDNESRPILACYGGSSGSSGGVGSSSGSSGWSGSGGVGSSSGSSGEWSGSGGITPPTPTISPPGYPLPPPSSCQLTWELGGDDEEFSLLRELDALPGTDVTFFKNMRLFAYTHGYVRPIPPPPPVTDAGAPPSPSPSR